MKVRLTKNASLMGAGLAVFYTLVSTLSDASAKFISMHYAAPQLFALSGGLVALISFLGAARKGNLGDLKTAFPFAVALRSVATVVSASLFFYAFRMLSLAEIFVFVGITPILAALLAPVVLQEKVDSRAWVALLAGVVGILWLFPDGLATLQTGHAVAFGACLSGALSMVLARYVGKRETKPLSLVFYPHALMCVVMLGFLPFVYKAMTPFDMGIAALYSTLLFLGRFILVRALALAPAHVVTPVMNMQFLWMVVVGAAMFGEIPTLNVYIGALFVIGSCIYLVKQSSTSDMVKPAIRLVTVNSAPLPTVLSAKSKNLSRSRMNSWHSDSQSQSAPRSALR